MATQAERNEAARKLGAGLADILAATAVGVPVGALAEKSVEYFQKQLAANQAAADGDNDVRREARALARRAFRKPISAARLRRGSEATLLRAERGVVPFAGRETELAEFAAWYDDPAPMRWRLLTGPSGRGKTRFMQHVVETYARERGDRLLAGFIDVDTVSRAPEALAAFLAHEGEVLLVVDYAERARAQTTAILKLALMLEAAAAAGAGLKVRVVLIARGLSEVWEQIGGEHEDIGEILKSEGDLFVQEDLPALVDAPEARRAEFARAYAAFDKVLNPDASAEGRAPSADRIPSLEPVPSRDDFKEAAMIHLAALAAVQGAMRVDEMTDTRLLDWIIDRERREWLKRAEGVLTLPGPVHRRALDEAVGVVTLAAAASQEPSEARVTDLLAACPRLSESPNGEREALAMVLHDLHPGETGPVGLTPDLVGVYFLSLLDEGFFTSVFAALNDQEARIGLTKLNQLAQSRRDGRPWNSIAQVRIDAALAAAPAILAPLVVDVALQSGDPIGRIAADWIAREKTPGLVSAVFEHPARNDAEPALREFWAAVDGRLVEQARAEEDDDGQHRLATALNNLSVSLNALGRREEALRAVEEAVSLNRALANEQPSVFSSDLAVALNNLSKQLSSLGRWEEALAASEEAVDAYRQLPKPRRSVFTPGLAQALRDLSEQAAHLGQLENALASIEECLKYLNYLTRVRRGKFKKNLDNSLIFQAKLLYIHGEKEKFLKQIRNLEIKNIEIDDEIAKFLEYTIEYIAKNGNTRENKALEDYNWQFALKFIMNNSNVRPMLEGARRMVITEMGFRGNPHFRMRVTTFPVTRNTDEVPPLEDVLDAIGWRDCQIIDQSEIKSDQIDDWFTGLISELLKEKLIEIELFDEDKFQNVIDSITNGPAAMVSMSPLKPMEVFEAAKAAVKFVINDKDGKKILILTTFGYILFSFVGPYLTTLAETVATGHGDYFNEKLLSSEEIEKIEQLNERVEKERKATDFEEGVIHELTDDRSGMWL